MKYGENELADRMKWYEERTVQYVDTRAPIVARLDGRGFSALTKRLKCVKPYDPMMHGTMIGVAQWLMSESHATVAYTQSDEITLVWLPGNKLPGAGWFAGRVQKIGSVLASLAGAAFERGAYGDALRKDGVFATFDCRVFGVPTQHEAANVIRWRVEDAERNAILGMAHAHLPAGELHGQSCAALRDRLRDEVGERYEDWPGRFVRGSYLTRGKERRRFSTAEIRDLPEKHAARLNPEMEFERSKIVVWEMPILWQLAGSFSVVLFGNTEGT